MVPLILCRIYSATYMAPYIQSHLYGVTFSSPGERTSHLVKVSLPDISLYTLGSSKVKDKYDYSKLHET